MENLNILPATALNTEDPSPGIYQDVPDSQYFKVKAVNNSQLSDLLPPEGCPAKFKYEREHEDYTSSPSQLLGSIAHVKLLQPEQFEDRAMKIPTHNKNSGKFHSAITSQWPDADLSKSNKWADNLAEIEKAYPNAIIGDHKDFDQAVAMINKLKWADREWGGWILENVLAEGYAEVVLVWEDPKHGFLCKAKLDWWNPEMGAFMDYKTTRDASPSKFCYSVSDYGYHRQQAHYWNGTQVLGMGVDTSMILAQETSPPYVHHWFEFEFDPAKLGLASKARGTEWQVAHYQLELAKKTLAYCKENDYWPGFTVNKEVPPISPLALKYDDYRTWEEDPFTSKDDGLPFDNEEGDPADKLKEVRGPDGQGIDPAMDMTIEDLGEDTEVFPNKSKK